MILALVLLQAPLSTIQLNPYIEAFGYESPAEQTETSIFRTPSELTLEEALHKPLRAPNDDGWLDLPGGYGGTDNALKVPIGNGWEILILAGAFYILFLFLYNKRKKMKKMKKKRE